MVGRNQHGPGVTFHKRLGRFSAQIMRNRQRVHLGYFADAQEASNAYLVAKAGMAEVKTTWGNKAAIAKALAGGPPAIGFEVTMADSPQVYRLIDFVQVPAKRGGTTTMFRWRSRCAECDAPFETVTTPKPSAFTRTCPAHREKGAPIPKLEAVQLAARSAAAIERRRKRYTIEEIRAWQARAQSSDNA